MTLFPVPINNINIKHPLAVMAAVFFMFSPFHIPTSNSMEIVDQIVAVVNEDIITAKQLDNRLSFALKNVPGNLSKSEKKELVRTQIQELIEEELILQYAEENGYEASQQQIDKAIAKIEKQNKKTPGSFMRFAGDAQASALRSIKSNVLTQQIQQRELKRKVQIADRDVNRIVQGIVSRKDENKEFKLAQIFLPIDDSDKAKQIRHTAERLHQQLQQGEATFANLVRAYSRDSSAKNGGVLGWFRQGELVQDIARAVKNLEKGELSQPTRTSNGWHIFKILDERMPEMPNLEPTTELNLIQLYAPFDSTSNTPKSRQKIQLKGVFKDLAQDVQTAQNTKDAFTKMIETQKEKNPLFMASGNMGWVQTKTLSPKIQSNLERATTGEIVGPVATTKGISLFYVSDKRTKEAPALEKLRQRVRDRLTNRQLDLEMRRFIRDLRRAAFSDIRL